MSRLTLEKTMQTSFVDIGDTSSDRAFHDFNDRIGRLAENGKLRIEAIQELIDSRVDTSELVDITARTALTEVAVEDGEKLFLLGYTAIVATDEGHIIGAQEKPNEIPELQKYGSSLMWAMRKIGHERYAKSRTGSTASEQRGYAAVSKLLTGKLLEDIPYGERHHIGGSLVIIENADLRETFTELYAGVSGVVATDAFRNKLAALDDRIQPIASEALLNKRAHLDDFMGNMFAGSLDSTLGAFILEAVKGYETGGLFTETAVMSIARRYASGINVH